MFIFPITVPIIISAIISTKRIERFLSQKEIEKELEGVRNMARILSKSDTSFDLCEENKQLLDEKTDKKVSNANGTTAKQLDEKSVEQMIIINDDEAFKQQEKVQNTIRNEHKLDENLLEKDSNVDDLMNKSNQSKVKLRKQNQLSTKTRAERNRTR